MALENNLNNIEDKEKPINDTEAKTAKTMEAAENPNPATNKAAEMLKNLKVKTGMTTEERVKRMTDIGNNVDRQNNMRLNTKTIFDKYTRKIGKKVAAINLREMGRNERLQINSFINAAKKNNIIGANTGRVNFDNLPNNTNAKAIILNEINKHGSDVAIYMNGLTPQEQIKELDDLNYALEELYDTQGQTPNMKIMLPGKAIKYATDLALNEENSKSSNRSARDRIAKLQKYGAIQ